MKQHITKEQAVEILGLEGRAKLITYINGRTDIEFIEYELIEDDYRSLKRLPLLNIGQIIEFLGEDLRSIKLIAGTFIVKNKLRRFNSESGELIDSLWKAVKEKLKSTKEIMEKISKNFGGAIKALSKN